MSLRRLVAIAVGCLMLVSFAVVWLMFAEMYRTGTAEIHVVADRYGEFWIEAILYALGMLCLPVAIYEADLWFRDR
jgi:hypothetical protein